MTWIIIIIPLCFNGTPAGNLYPPTGWGTVILLLGVFAGGYAFALSSWRRLEHYNYNMLAVLISCLLIASGETPWLDDDIFRYQWDGFVGTIGESPLYTLPIHAPSYPNFSSTGQQISYPDIPTVYGPASQWLFTILYALFERDTQLWMLFFAIVTWSSVLLLTRIWKEMSVLPFLIIAIQFNPILLKEFADSAHIDIVAIFLCLASLWIILKNKKPSILPISGVLFALAMLVKPTSVLVLIALPRRVLKKVIFFWIPLMSTLILLTSLYYKNIDSFIYSIEMINYFRKYWIFNPFLPDFLNLILNPDTLSPNQWFKSIAISNIISSFSLVAAVFFKAFKYPNAMLWTIMFFFLAQGALNVWYSFWMLPVFTALIIEDFTPNDFSLHSIIYVIWFFPLFAALSGYLFWAQKEVLWIPRAIWTLFISIGAFIAINAFSQKGHDEEKILRGYDSGS